MKQQKTQSGFAHIMIVTVILAVALIGTLGYVYWQNFMQPKASDGSKVGSGKSTDTPTPTPAQTTSTFTIDTVTFVTPKNWTEDVISPTSVSLLPGEKLRTVYGDGTEYFNIHLSVNINSGNLSPESWLSSDAGNGVGGLGLMSSGDTESSAKINGYDAYYRKINSDVYQEVHYVISASGKFVYINARTYQTSSDLPGVGDFRKFEPAIAALAQSVVIK